MKVLVADRAIPHQPERSMGQRLVEGFRQAGHQAYFHGSFYCEPTRILGGNVLQEVDAFDLVVYTEMTDGWPGYEYLFQHHKLRNVPRFYWDFDVSYNTESNLEYASRARYDGYLVANRHFLDTFATRFSKPVLHLPYACSPQWEYPTTNKKEYLIGFIGSLLATSADLGDREKMVRMIQERVPDTFVTEGLYNDELTQATNKLCVMFHKNRDDDRCRGLVPCRPWEVTACGVTLMMDRGAYEDFAEFLPEDLRGDLLVYDSPDDLCSLVDTQLDWSNWSDLNARGEALGEFVRANHSYKQRAERIIEWAKELNLL